MIRVVAAAGRRVEGVGTCVVHAEMHEAEAEAGVGGVARKCGSAPGVGIYAAVVAEVACAGDEMDAEADEEVGDATVGEGVAPGEVSAAASGAFVPSVVPSVVPFAEAIPVA